MWNHIAVSITVLCFITQSNYVQSQYLEELETYAELHKQCVRGANVVEDRNIQSYDWFLPQDHEIQCYVNCLLEKAGLIDDDGNIELEFFTESMSDNLREMVYGIIAKCKTIRGKDPCETAWLTIQCYLEAVTEYFESSSNSITDFSTFSI